MQAPVVVLSTLVAVVALDLRDKHFADPDFHLQIPKMGRGRPAVAPSFPTSLRRKRE